LVVSASKLTRSDPDEDYAKEVQKAFEEEDEPVICLSEPEPTITVVSEVIHETVQLLVEVHFLNCLFVLIFLLKEHVTEIMEVTEVVEVMEELIMTTEELVEELTIVEEVLPAPVETVVSTPVVETPPAPVKQKTAAEINAEILAEEKMVKDTGPKVSGPWRDWRDSARPRTSSMDTQGHSSNTPAKYGLEYGSMQNTFLGFNC
jgi:hypothetical protein